MSTKEKKGASESGRGQYDVTPEKFIEVWQTSNSVDEVSEKLGMPKPIAHARASGYRSAGVKLKKFPRGGAKRKLDVDGLNELIAALEVQTKAETPDEAVKKVLSGLKK